MQQESLPLHEFLLHSYFFSIGWSNIFNSHTREPQKINSSDKYSNLVTSVFESTLGLVYFMVNLVTIFRAAGEKHLRQETGEEQMWLPSWDAVPHLASHDLTSGWERLKGFTCPPGSLSPLPFLSSQDGLESHRKNWFWMTEEWRRSIVHLGEESSRTAPVIHSSAWTPKLNEISTSAAYSSLSIPCWGGRRWEWNRYESQVGNEGKKNAPSNTSKFIVWLNPMTCWKL